MILVLISSIFFPPSFKLYISFIHLCIQPMYLFSILYITFVLVLGHSDCDTRFQALVIYLEGEVMTIAGIEKWKEASLKTTCYVGGGDN